MSRVASLVPSQFDAFFEARSHRDGVAPVPFTLGDYRKYVDGRPRKDAIRAFLRAR